jgi:hypothetical protein
MPELFLQVQNLLFYEQEFNKPTPLARGCLFGLTLAKTGFKPIHCLTNILLSIEFSVVKRTM